jgi:hypothetical protein
MLQVRTKLGWKISKDLLLKVDAKIDESFMAQGVKQFKMGPKLSEYVASMANSMDNY